MIKNIEQFGPKLHIKRVGDFLDVIVLEERKIEIHQSRADDRVAAQIPAKRNGIRHGETLRLDVVRGIAGVDKRATTRTGNQIRHIDVRVGTLHTQGVFTPRASPPKPGVNGTPVLASKTPPISHPLRTHPVAPWAHFGAPISQV